MNCPFCNPDSCTCMLENEHAVVIPDAYPVTKGHSLVIPRRHVSSYFDLNPDERREMWDLVDNVRRRLQEQHNPDGFNIGINIGDAAGQTVDHVHIHVIPRYEGDIEDPTGGVRGVIPAKQNYKKPE